MAFSSRQIALANTQTVDEEHLTSPGSTLGTVAYMSPEQVKGKELDARTDLFSFGAVLYEMATGALPFHGETSGLIFKAILDSDPRPAIRFNREIPPKLEEVIDKALEKDRNLRYQSAADMRTDLQRLRRAAESGHREISAADGKKFRWRAQAAVASGGVGLIILIVAAIFAMSSNMRKVDSIDSLAVLPIVSNSADEDTQFLSDGITDSLIDSLSQIPNLKVMSRTSAFYYKGREIDPQAVGRELKVKAVLTGRLIHHGDDLFVSAELVNATDNSHIWGGEYKRKVSDVLALQCDLAQALSGKLGFYPFERSEAKAFSADHVKCRGLSAVR
jgi:TolB-like protein